jgi:hypothetical protein
MLTFKKTDIKFPAQPLSIMFLGDDVLQGDVYEAGNYQIVVHCTKKGNMYVVRTKNSLGAFDAIVHSKSDLEEYFKGDEFVRNRSINHKAEQVDLSNLP